MGVRVGWVWMNVSLLLRLITILQKQPLIRIAMTNGHLTIVWVRYYCLDPVPWTCDPTNVVLYQCPTHVWTLSVCKQRYRIKEAIMYRYFIEFLYLNLRGSELSQPRVWHFTNWSTCSLQPYISWEHLINVQIRGLSFILI